MVVWVYYTLKLQADLRAMCCLHIEEKGIRFQCTLTVLARKTGLNNEVHLQSLWPISMRDDGIDLVPRQQEPRVSPEYTKVKKCPL